MPIKKLPLQELSIAQIYNGDLATYEVPIYQRNYAWEKDEISALVQDVYDAFSMQKSTYFIGTLVTFNKGDQIFEVIDGQQRLTTINITLKALGISLKNKLSYRARKKSDATIKNIPHFEIEDKDDGIINGYNFAVNAINEIIPENELDSFKNYFQDQVHIIHYQVPKDIDLNHYFEVMNSRGEQLEKHEIIKARLIEQLNEKDKEKFNKIWEYCSEMNVYIQQKYRDVEIFGKNHSEFILDNFDSLPKVEKDEKEVNINDLLGTFSVGDKIKQTENLDSFQPIIDFPNFLLIILKLTRIKEENFSPTDFTLDDKELIKEFDKVPLIDEHFTKQFGYNLLKGKYFLDNYIAHHSYEDEKPDNNPWKLQYWNIDNSQSLKNLGGISDSNSKLVQLLSMFEVSFTARQRKNYLFYCLIYLFDSNIYDINKYSEFVLKLAEKYFKDVYLVQENLSAINTPNPGSFDRIIIKEGKLNIQIENPEFNFTEIYGDGTEISRGIPLFVFNYLDYKIWEKYFDELRGEKTREGSTNRKSFFEQLGSSDFGLRTFENFYFSRTRRSLEHFFPTANVNNQKGVPTIEQINCFGNYAMIGSEANSSGSNWSPISKLSHYLDQSGKIRLVSVASLKFMIMMQKCKDNQKDDIKNGFEWTFEDIKMHQDKMLKIVE